MIGAIVARVMRFLSQKQTADEQPRVVVDDLAGKGWLAWYNPYGVGVLSPREFTWVWIMRPEWPEPRLVAPTSLHPMMNVIGLYWAPAAVRVAAMPGEAVEATYRVH